MQVIQRAHFEKQDSNFFSNYFSRMKEGIKCDLKDTVTLLVPFHSELIHEKDCI